MRRQSRRIKTHSSLFCNKKLLKGYDNTHTEQSTRACVFHRINLLCSVFKNGYTNPLVLSDPFPIFTFCCNFIITSNFTICNNFLSSNIDKKRCFPCQRESIPLFLAPFIKFIKSFELIFINRVHLLFCYSELPVSVSFAGYIKSCIRPVTQ